MVKDAAMMKVDPASVDATELEVAHQIGQSMGQLKRLMTCAAMHMNRVGIEWASFALLAHLVTGGPRRSSALAELVFTDPSTVSRQVAQLVKDGYVERRADPDDGRVSVLAATDEGKAFFQTRVQGRNAAIAHVIADWPAEERQKFAELFARFTANYERELPGLMAGYEEEFGGKGKTHG